MKMAEIPSGISEVTDAAARIRVVSLLDVVSV